jgi:hypothetical protein
MTSKYAIERKRLNKQVTELRRVISDRNRFDDAMQLFFEVHAQMHSARVSDGDSWSFEDALMDDLDEDVFRRIPKNQDHSIAWCLWHIARIEDVTMNLLVVDQAQVFFQNQWLARLGISRPDCGNAMSLEEMIDLSQTIDMQSLRTYRREVGKRTRQIVEALSADDLRQPVNPVRIERVWDEDALVEAAQGIADYWASRNIAGLLLMPASRHCLTHLNEALKLKHRRA